jgi:hypothetical protein
MEDEYGGRVWRTSMEVFEVARPTLRGRGLRTDSRFFSHRILSRSGN